MSGRTRNCGPQARDPESAGDGAVSAEPCRCHSCVGAWWVESRDAVHHPAVPRMVPAAESDPRHFTLPRAPGLPFSLQGCPCPLSVRDCIHHGSCPGSRLLLPYAAGETGSLDAGSAGAQVCGLLSPQSTVSLRWPLGVCKTPEAGSS